jgi:hypothetical protein
LDPPQVLAQIEYAQAGTMYWTELHINPLTRAEKAYSFGNQLGENKMKPYLSSKLLAVVALVFFLTAVSFAQGFDGRSPLSTSVLVARALRNGTLHFDSNATLPPAGVLGNVQASEGGSPVNEDPIVANPINPRQLLTGGNDYNCGSLQGFYTTGDGGKTWSHTCLGTLAGHSGVGDPGVGYDLNGTAYITGIDEGSNNVIVFETSTNNGQSWSSPAIAVSATFSGGLTDKDWLQVDTNLSSPFKNSLYISVTQFDASETHTQISVTHSNDGGSSWNTVLVDTAQAAPIYDQFSDLAVGKDGAVYVTWIRCNASAGDCGGSATSMMFSKSTDGGNTWSSPVTMATVMLAPDRCGCAFYGNLPNTSERVSNIPAVDVDNSNGSHAIPVKSRLPSSRQKHFDI